MVRVGLGYLAAADPTAMPAQAQAECLLELEQQDAISTAARAWILSAFAAGHGYAADADYSATSWLIHKSRVTKGAARGHLGWLGRGSARAAASEVPRLGCLAIRCVVSREITSRQAQGFARGHDQR
jgi:hypothetical protein